MVKGIPVGKERVQKLMQRHGIRAKGKRRFKAATNSNHDLLVAPNLLDREFDVAEPNRVWVGDITYIATNEGWVFLTVVIDLFSRQVVGWPLRDDMTQDIVIAALRMAWFRGCPGKEAKSIFHSDWGSQGRNHRVAGLVRQNPTAPDAGLCQPDTVRAGLAGRTGQTS